MLITYCNVLDIQKHLLFNKYLCDILFYLTFKLSKGMTPFSVLHRSLNDRVNTLKFNDL